MVECRFNTRWYSALVQQGRFEDYGNGNFLPLPGKDASSVGVTNGCF